MGKCFSGFIILLLVSGAVADIIPVGSGSYTDSFPGVDEAGRNSFPPGTPQVSGPAADRPVPTNDWWSSVIQNDHVSNLFNYPMTMKTTPQGLVVSYIPWGVIDDQEPIVVGVSDLNAGQAEVYDYTDWTVTLEWTGSGHSFRTVMGIGMPFLYFTKETADVARVTVNLGNVTVDGENILIADARNDADFIVFAPEGSSWEQNGSVFTSDLNGQDYWSMAMLPQSESDLNAFAQEYRQYAFVFPANTMVTWNYDENNSVLRSDYQIDTDVKEGQFSNVLQGLLPHQWNNLAGDSPAPGEYPYTSIRGELRTLSGNQFSTENTFRGILPTLPNLASYSPGFNPAELEGKISLIENDELPVWTDSYNEGQLMNRLIQTARIAHETGNTEARDQIISTVQERLEDWLTAEASEVAFLFYYNSTWSTLIGYPAGHGQDSNINDHHFHWGYFVHAAAFVEQFNPGWADQWGDMVNLLIRDAASADRNDQEYPFLRSFSPYAGHCWANGFASFPQGNDQESSSESMQFNSALIHWGSITGNDEIRDLGIYLYTTEQTAIEEYWFDIYERNLADDHPYSLVSRVWGNSYDNGTFWTNDIAASYGIEMYPIHGGSLYLGHHPDYVQTLWNEITMNTGILSNEVNPNLWHDVMWKYLAFIDPQAAIGLYDSYPDRELKFGVSDAQTCYWLHCMNALGVIRTDITANTPIAAVFENDGTMTYAAHNYSAEPRLVTFSNGYQLEAAAGELATNRGNSIAGTISSAFQQAGVNGSIQLTVETETVGVTQVEFYDGTDLLGTLSAPPYEFLAAGLSAGNHGMYARIHVDNEHGLTNIINVQVGEQVPYTGAAFELPGVIEAGYFDSFQGGVGQGISYYDVSVYNEGGYRPEEYVDVEYSSSEGYTLGWTAASEWVEYSIQVPAAGYYHLSLRAASGNTNGGGPFHIECDDQAVTDDISIDYTGGWYNWVNVEVNNVALHSGEHILKVAMDGGEFNLGRMTFSYQSELDYYPPVADAGEDVVVVLPETVAVLDGSGSYDEDSAILFYSWQQIFGPTMAEFSDSEAVSPQVGGLIEGTYKFRLQLDDGEHTSQDDVFVYVSSTSNLAPSISLVSPAMNSSFYFGTPIDLLADADDLDGSVALVEFYAGETFLGEATSEPYYFEWLDAEIGEYQLTGRAVDDGGLITVSAPVEITVLEAVECTGGPENGHYTYEFSDDLNDPTLTFIPSAEHVGNPTCILYYSTGGTPPGYFVTPNVPFQIYASEGETITFYYTYSYNGLEENTSADPHTYVIGSCNSDLSNDDPAVPQEYVLYQNYPNPFNPETTIRYDLPEYAWVSIRIYDSLGREIRTLVNGVENPGHKKVIWDSENNLEEPAAAGLYLYTIQVGGFIQTRKMVLIR